jgi:cyclopropane fatty-acyl-phospholipid synthase-like methyltransferase
VRRACAFAGVTADDVVVDLGCGSGTFVCHAANEIGVHGIGWDFNPERIKDANLMASQLAVQHRVQFAVNDVLKVCVASLLIFATSSYHPLVYVICTGG